MKKSLPYILLAPALIFTIFVLVYPLFQNLINSFMDVSLIKGSSGWVGLKNYLKVLQDVKEHGTPYPGKIMFTNFYIPFPG